MTTPAMIILEFSEPIQDFHIKVPGTGPDEFTHGYLTVVRGITDKIGFEFVEYIRKRYKLGRGGDVTMRQVQEEWHWFRYIFKKAGSKEDLPDWVKYQNDRDYMPDDLQREG